jgi:uncharacterized membrane protein
MKKITVLSAVALLAAGISTASFGASSVAATSKALSMARPGDLISACLNTANKVKVCGYFTRKSIQKMNPKARKDMNFTIVFGL